MYGLLAGAAVVTRKPAVIARLQPVAQHHRSAVQARVVCAHENFILFYFFGKSRLTSRHFADALSFML